MERLTNNAQGHRTETDTWRRYPEPAIQIQPHTPVDLLAHRRAELAVWSKEAHKSFIQVYLD
jgi:hypothetical protein